MNRKFVRQVFLVFRTWVLSLLFLGVLAVPYTSRGATPDFERSDELLIQSQDMITGNVTDAETGEPLIGVSVIVKGTTNGTTTDVNGSYRLEVDSATTLVFSFIGYESKEVNIGNQSVIDVGLNESLSELDEVVVVGYGTQRKRDVTGAIASVDEEQLSQRVPANVFEAFQGQMAGVQMNTGSGQPGEGASLRIRGTSTFNGGTEPLYVVDGQPVNSITDLNPNDIKSVEILKDGASAAIYGSRSANGVVLITTKLGQTGETDINVSYLRSYGNVRKMPQANAQERFLYDQLRGQTTRNAPNGTDMFLDTLNTMYNRNNYWIDVYYRTAVKDQANVSVSGGNESTKFYTNVGILNQEGIAPNSGYMRLNGRLNIDHEFNDRVKTGIRMQMSYGEQNNLVEGDEEGVISAVLIKGAYSSYLEPDGSYQVNNNSFRGRENLLYYYDVTDAKDRDLRGNYFQYLEVEILEGLKYRANGGVNFDYSRNTFFEPEYIGCQCTNVTSSFYSALSYSWIHESYLTLDKKLGDHNISAVAGFSAQKWGRPEESIKGNLANSLIPTLNNFAGLDAVDLGQTYTRNQNDHSLASVFARASYSFRDKYLASATIRRDGSSRFGPQNRWGNFPSVSLGWRFSEEAFLQNQNFLDNGKIRVSYAITGNERINNRDFDFLLDIGNFYNGLNGVGLTNQLGNPGIQWEETAQTNLGLDLGFIGGRINMTIDLYDKQTSELLANLPLPAQTGFNQTRVNLGEVQNRGIEISLQAVPVDINGIRWETNFNYAHNQNEVLSMAGDGVPIVTRNHRTEVGQPLGNFYGYQILGIYPTDAANTEGITANGTTLGAGDYIWQDTDGDGSITGDDRVILGNAYPKHYGGWRNQVSYKGITFSFLFDYQFDVEVYNHFFQTMANFTLNSWTPWPEIINNTFEGEGDETALYPDERRSQNTLGTSAPTSYSVENASFIKLRNIKLSYELPNAITEKIKMDRVTVFGAINNALTWTNYRLWDPEVTSSNANALNAGVDDGRYPRLREYLFGININF